MRLAVQYRIDVHAYDPQRGECSPVCLACHLERFIFSSAAEARHAQPEELADDDRFEIVVLDHCA